MTTSFFMLQRWIQDSGCTMIDVKFSTLDNRCWMFNNYHPLRSLRSLSGCHTSQDSRLKTQDSRRKTKDLRQKTQKGIRELEIGLFGLPGKR